MDEADFGGYKVAYGGEESRTLVYVLMAVSLGSAIGFFSYGSTALALLCLASGVAAYHNFPLIETSRPRILANQYGIFIDGLGGFRWSAIDTINLVPIAVRTLTVHEMQLKLRHPLPQSLMVDWRSLPWYRLIMRLPWKMSHDNVIRLKLDVFDQPPDRIGRTITRMWRHYRS